MTEKERELLEELSSGGTMLDSLLDDDERRFMVELVSERYVERVDDFYRPTNPVDIERLLEDGFIVERAVRSTNGRA